MTASVTVIVPVAKDGPRAGGKPTWMLTHPKGYPVLLSVLQGLTLTKVKRVIVATTEDHVARFLGGSTNSVRRSMIQHSPDLDKLLEFHCLQAQTDSAPATIAAVIEECKVASTDSIFIKDGDGSFEVAIDPVNCVIGLQLMPGKASADIEDLPSKSYIQHTNLFLSNIQEKKMISDMICVGGYGFEKASDFLEAHAEVREHARNVQLQLGEPYRLFNSHIVHHLLLKKKKIFCVKTTSHFEDFKTDAAWRKYLQKHRNIFVALEGVLFGRADQTPVDNISMASPDSGLLPSVVTPDYFGPSPLMPRSRKSMGDFDDANDNYVPIERNVTYIRKVKAEEQYTRIIVTTYRGEWEKEGTEELLRSHNVPFDDIVFGLMRCTSISVQPYGESLPHPSAVSYCVPEGSAQLGSILHLK